MKINWQIFPAFKLKPILVDWLTPAEPLSDLRYRGFWSERYHANKDLISRIAINCLVELSIEAGISHRE
jgi:hypothetical protein